MPDGDQNNTGRGRGRPRLPDPTEPVTLPPQRRKVKQMTAAEKDAKRAYDRLATRRSREVRRRNRVLLDSFPGVDTLALTQRLQAEGLSPRQIQVTLPIAVREENQRLQLERDLTAERRARKKAEDDLHDTKYRLDPAYRASRGAR